MLCPSSGVELKEALWGSIINIRGTMGALISNGAHFGDHYYHWRHYGEALLLMGTLAQLFLRSLWGSTITAGGTLLGTVIFGDTMCALLLLVCFAQLFFLTTR